MRERQLTVAVGVLAVALAAHLIVDVRQDDVDQSDINWYCGDPEDVAWGGQVVVIHCRQHESMLDGNDGVEPLAEMDIWLNRDGLINGIEGVYP